MPLPSVEPNVEVRDLLAANWDANNVGETFDTAWIGTGWWNEDTPNPQVTLTGVSEDTSPDGIDPSGKGLTSWVDVVIDCNVWVPLDEAYESAGVAKQFRWDLIKEVHRIIENNQTGSGELSRLETGQITRDPTEPPPPFRAHLPIGAQYHTAPE